MNKKVATFLFMVFFAVASILATGCSSGGSKGSQAGGKAYENQSEGVYKDKVVVGSSLALSGTLAYMGKAIQEGAATYFNEVNEKGGVNGRKIEFKAYDDKYEPAETMANAKLLAERDKVLALVAPLGTATVLAAEKYLDKQNIGMVGALSIADSVSSPPRRVVFALPSPQSCEASAYVNYAVKTLGKKKIAILYQNDAWGQPAYDFAKKELQRNKLDFVEVQTFERLASDLTSQVMKLKSANPEVVIFYALGQQAAMFLDGAKKLGWNPIMFGASGLNSLSFTKMVGENAEGLYVGNSYKPLDSNDPAIEEFKKSLAKHHPGSTPDMNGMMGYSAAKVFVEALTKMGPEPGRQKLIDTLENMSGFDQGIGPKISFGKLGKDDWVRRGQTAIMIMQYKGGKFVPVSDWIDTRQN